MKIGFVGLGIMGKPMAKNLLKAGYEVVAYDIVGEALEEVVSEGAESGESPKDVAFLGKKYSNKNYVANKPGRNSVHDLTRLLRVSSYPTLMFMDSKFNIMGIEPGYKDYKGIEVFYLQGRFARHFPTPLIMDLVQLEEFHY